MAALHTDCFVRNIHRLLLGVSPQFVRASSRLGGGGHGHNHTSVFYPLLPVLHAHFQAKPPFRLPSSLGLSQAGKLPAGPGVKSSLD